MVGPALVNLVPPLILLALATLRPAGGNPDAKRLYDDLLRHKQHGYIEYYTLSCESIFSK